MKKPVTSLLIIILTCIASGCATNEQSSIAYDDSDDEYVSASQLTIKQFKRNIPSSGEPNSHHINEVMGKLVIPLAYNINRFCQYRKKNGVWPGNFNHSIHPKYFMINSTSFESFTITQNEDNIISAEFISKYSPAKWHFELEAASGSSDCESASFKLLAENPAGQELILITGTLPGVLVTEPEMIELIESISSKIASNENNNLFYYEGTKQHEIGFKDAALITLLLSICIYALTQGYACI